MDDIIFLKDRDLQDVTPVDNIFITRYMPAAPEFAVKAYLFGLMRLSCPMWECGDFLSVFGCKEEDVISAFAYWEAAGLVRIIGKNPLRVQYLSVKNAVSAAPARSDSTRYGDFVREVQAVLGTRVLSGAELSKLYDWLDVFGFEQSAAVEIVNHCLDKKGAKTGVAYMDAVAKTLVGKGCFTLEDVKRSFADEEILSSGAARILKRWNRRSLPTEDQIALYEKWTKAWGFDDEGISLACEQMTAADKPSFKYLDSILASWHDNGAVDRAKIEEIGRRDDILTELARKSFAKAGVKRSATREDKLQFGEWRFDWVVSEELILLAAEHAGGSPRPFAEMKRLLKDWHEAGISSVSAAEQRLESAPVKGGKQGGSRALNYMHGAKYSDEELKKLGITLGEEFYTNGK